MLISTDENGNAVRITVENTDNNCQFELMKELMVSLTVLSWESTRLVFEQRFERIVNFAAFIIRRWTTPSSPSRT